MKIKPDLLRRRGVEIESRSGEEVGLTNGNWRACHMEGCKGVRLSVRWPDGRYTYPCSKGLIWHVNRWRIG